MRLFGLLELPIPVLQGQYLVFIALQNVSLELVFLCCPFFGDVLTAVLCIRFVSYCRM
jgi:hypothetical protein